MKYKIWLTLLPSFVFLIILNGCKTTSPSEPATITVKQGITGTVTAADTHSALSGVTVSISAANQTTTNSQGVYGFDNVPVGDYTVSFSKSGYVDESQPVHVDSGSSSVLNLSLQSALNLAVLKFHVVDDRTGSPIPNAKVIGEGDSVYTDLSGNAMLTYKLISGDVQITISAKNCLSVTKFVVREQHQTTFDTTRLVRFGDYLVCDYRFAGNFLDSSGKGHDATPHGTKFVADRFGNASGALQLNGTTDYVSVADAADLNFGKSTDFTICFWLNYSPEPSTSATPYYIFKGTDVSNILTGYEVTFYQYYYKALAGTTYGETQVTDSHSDYGDGRWHLVTCVYKRSSGISIYVDGKLNRQGDDPNSYLPGNINTTASLLIGGTGVAKNAYKGAIDDVKIYGVALNDEAVIQVYHENGW